MIDFLSISDDNQSVVVFTNGMLDAIAALLRTTTSGFAVYHGLHALTYLSTSVAAHHMLARHAGTLEVLLDTMSEHGEDPARCEYGLLAMCNLASQPANAIVIQAAYNLDAIVDAILRQSQDPNVLAYCEELLQRLQPLPLESPQVSHIAHNDPQRTPETPKQKVSFNEDSFVTHQEEPSPRETEGSWRGNWDDFDKRWQDMRQEVMGKAMPSVDRGKGGGGGGGGRGEGGGGGGGGADDPLALLDRYEAELNATMAEMNQNTGGYSPSIRTLAPIPATVKVPKVEGTAKFKQLSPPRPHAFAQLNLDDSDEEGISRPKVCKKKGAKKRLGVK